MALHGIDGLVDGAVVGIGLGVLLLFVWLMVRAAGGFPTRSEDTPEQILKRRYARGEIDREEYQRRLEDLRR